MNKFVHWDFEQVFELGLSKAEIGLFFRVAVAAGRENICRASVTTIAKWVNSTVQWTRRSLKNLEQAGVLVIERSCGGAGNVNIYRISIGENSASNRTGKKTNTVETSTQNPVGNDVKTRFENAPQKEEYKRKSRKEECVRSMCYSFASGKTSAQERTVPEGDTHSHTAGGVLKYYPLKAEELMPYYPDVERRVIENYLYKRNSTNWVRKNGHRLRPHEILLDFSVWMARETDHDQIPQARYSPPPERQAQQEESDPVRKSHSAELIKYLMGA